MNIIDEYIDIVPSLNYVPVNNNEWEIIDEWEGITELFDIYDRERYQIAELPLTDEDSEELKQETDNILNKFNEFDIRLKNKYNMKYIDLIDYENGIVKIVKII